MKCTSIHTPRQSKVTPVLILVACFFLLASFSSFRLPFRTAGVAPLDPTCLSAADTVLPRNNGTVQSNDVSSLSITIDSNVQQVKTQLQQLKAQLNEQQLRSAELARVQLQQLKAQISRQQVKAVEQAKTQVQQALASTQLKMQLKNPMIDLQQIKAQEAIARAFQDTMLVKSEALRAQLQQAVIDMDEAELHKTIEQANKAMADNMRQQLIDSREHIAVLKEQMKAARKTMKENMKQAGQALEAAKKQLLRSQQVLLARLKADGLINNVNDDKIEFRNGKLYINDKEQPDSVTDKYRGYFKQYPLPVELSPDGIIEF